MQLFLPSVFAVALFAVGSTGCRTISQHDSGQPKGAIAPIDQTAANYKESDSVARHEWKYYGPYVLTAGKLLIDSSGSGDVSLVVGPNGRPDPYIGIDNPLCLRNEGGVKAHCEISKLGTFYIGILGVADQSSYALEIKRVTADQLDEEQQGALDRDESKTFGPYLLGDGNLTIDLKVAGDIAFAAGPAQNGAVAVLTHPVCENNETTLEKSCEITASGTHYVVLRGSATHSSYTLHVKRDALGQAPIKSFTDQGNVERHEWKYFGPYQITSGSLKVTAAITGDLSLFVGVNALEGGTVQIREPLCLKNGSEKEKVCEISQPGTYYVGLLGVADHNNYTLTVSYPAETK